MKQVRPFLQIAAIAAAGPLLCLGAAFLLAACTGASSGEPVVEQEYVGDVPVDGAVLQETPNGGYRTVVGTPFVVVHDNAEPESMLPYGGGEEGLRQAEDESPNYSPDL